MDPAGTPSNPPCRHPRAWPIDQRPNPFAKCAADRRRAASAADLAPGVPGQLARDRVSPRSAPKVAAGAQGWYGTPHAIGPQSARGPAELKTPKEPDQ